MPSVALLIYCKWKSCKQLAVVFAFTIDGTGQLTGRLARMEVDRADIKNIRAIGAGQFGIVFEVEQTIEGFDQPQIRAVKALRQGATKLSMIDFVREAEILAELSHHNIVRLEGVCLQQQPWLLVEELVPYVEHLFVLLDNGSI
eukprot:m.120254 g.120254  ORF g.120254 m.120254 type:complete len:144 (+) comp15491_c0_seq2:1409-1840(+)